MVCPRCGKKTDTFSLRLGKRGLKISYNCIHCGYLITLKDILKVKIRDFFDFFTDSLLYILCIVLIIFCIFICNKI